MSRSSTVKSLTARLAEELAVEEVQVAAAVRLLDEGATVPFIARYRKEATGSLAKNSLRFGKEPTHPMRRNLFTTRTFAERIGLGPVASRLQWMLPCGEAFAAAADTCVGAPGFRARD